ncbi:hypothetical protein RJG79_08815 [Mycoplasmatota bacterium WC44]
MNRKTYELTLTSVLLSLVILLATVPNLGYIQLPFFPVGVTIIHIPVLIAGAIGSRKMATYLGVAFGLSSLLVALTRASGFADPLFTSPLVSLLPRLILGIVLVDIFRMAKAITKFDKSNVSGILVYFFTATIFHSLSVLSMMYFTAYTGWYMDILGTKAIITEAIVGSSSFIKFVYSILIANGLFEAIFACMVGVPIVKALIISKGRRL